MSRPGRQSDQHPTFPATTTCTSPPPPPPLSATPPSMSISCETLLTPLQRPTAAASAPAIVIPGLPRLEYSYAQLAAEVASVQAQLASLSLPPGKAVAASLINSLEFTVTFLATGAQQLVSAPLNPAYKQSEVEFYLDDTKAGLIVLHAGAVKGGSAAALAAQKLQIPIVEVGVDAASGHVVLTQPNSTTALPRADAAALRQARPEDVALVLHTSGTTGRPKAVPLTHANIARTMVNIVNTYQLAPRDRTLLVMPLFHVHGLVCGLLATLLSGGSAVVPPKFSASVFWNTFESEHCTWYTAVPTIHQMLLADKTPKPSASPVPGLRFIRSCSSSLSPPTFEAIEKTFGAPVLEAYAMTEAAHQMTSNPLPPSKRFPGSVGIGQGVEVRILDDKGDEVPHGAVAEVCIRGPNVTAGYLNNAKANAESFVLDGRNKGFFRTGDQGRQDEHGYVRLVGRIKELINRGGEKISPLEIDAALLGVPGVGEAVSFGAPDKMYGEKVNAAVVLKAGAKLGQDDIKAALKDKLAPYKIPETIFVSDQIPKTATGKVQRIKVAAAFLRPSKL